jgi:hypothetical protein
MYRTILRVALSFWILAFPFLGIAQESQSSNLGQMAFANCEFSIMETQHLKLGEESNGVNTRPNCFIALKPPNGLFIEASYDIRVIGAELFDSNRLALGVGFAQNAQSWLFQGTDLLLSSKMIKTSFSEKHIGEETLLVGNQLIKGNITQGGPITVPGIRILRITPQFVVSVELNFQPLHYEKQTRGYKQLREAVSQELVDIVKSVQVTPGVSGPTVRSATTP